MWCMGNGKAGVKLYSYNNLSAGLVISPDLDQKLSISSKHLVKEFFDQMTNKDPKSDQWISIVWLLDDWRGNYKLKSSEYVCNS